MSYPTVHEDRHDPRLSHALRELGAAAPPARLTDAEQVFITAKRRTTHRRVALGAVAGVAAIAIIGTTVAGINAANNDPSAGTVVAASPAFASSSAATAYPGVNNADPNEKAAPAPTLPPLTPADFAQQKWKKTAKDFGVNINRVVPGPGVLVLFGTVADSLGDTGEATGRIVVVDAAKGKVLWSTQTHSTTILASSVDSTSATGPAVIFTADQTFSEKVVKETQVVARNAADGSLRWSYPLGLRSDYDFSNGDITASGDTTVVRMGAQLWVFDSLSGTMRYTKKLGTPTNVIDEQVGSWTASTASATSVAAVARADAGKDLLQVWDAKTGTEQVNQTFTDKGLYSYSVALAAGRVVVAQAGQQQWSLVGFPLSANAQPWSKVLDQADSTFVTIEAVGDLLKVGYVTPSINGSPMVSKALGFRASDGELLWVRNDQEFLSSATASVTSPGTQTNRVNPDPLIDPANDVQLGKLPLPAPRNSDGTFDPAEWEDTQLVHFGAATVLLDHLGLKALVR